MQLYLPLILLAGSLNAEGRPSERMFLVGPLRKGLLWENTAVPELRLEARRMADLLGAA